MGTGVSLSGIVLLLESEASIYSVFNLSIVCTVCTSRYSRNLRIFLDSTKVPIMRTRGKVAVSAGFRALQHLQLQGGGPQRLKGPQ